MNETVARELMRSLTADLPVGSAPLQSTMDAGRRLRGRRRTAWAVTAAAMTVVALTSAAVLLRTDEPPEPVAPVRSLSGLAWWADDVLHLEGGTVPLPDVRALVQVPGGVVVLTDAGEVRRVDEDGAEQRIGRWRTGSAQSDVQPTVRAQDDGTVVWLDGASRPRHSLVVHDPTTGQRVASHAIPTGGFYDAAWLDDFEDGVVYWDTRAGQHSWDIATDEVTDIGTGATFLVTVENGVWVTIDATGDAIDILSAGRRLWTSTDSGGWFSPDGSTVVTLSGAPLRLRARDAATGRPVAGVAAVPVPSGLVDVHLGDDRTLAYVVGTETSQGIGAPYDLVACDLTTSQCTTIVAGATQLPVLPSD